MSTVDNTASTPASEDQILEKFGYRQEFRRELKHFASFAVGFSFISTKEELLPKRLLQVVAVTAYPLDAVSPASMP